ncbi:unnamed protein product [Acanthoscelides obtectus]|uniref:Uncharacterized protein n=1 Tax=Acanthoscelides obtectus TaxID=200917 RepID=A0A9P0PKI3_ACAOB|nr:unnamed protein product [Acanthoscelides obtectus]CAK1639378.1 Transposable element Tc1 transposase [Acanthoscelides obtectus]
MMCDCITPTVKHGGGSVMVWGGFSFNGSQRNFGKKKQYHSILVHKVVPAGTQLIGKGFDFQQDNDPKHTSTLCQDYLKKKEDVGTLKIMTWLPQSPDLNPIELQEVDCQVRKRLPTSQENLWTILKENLNNRIPRIVTAVLKAKGGKSCHM